MKFEAVVRTELGKGASRRLRHVGQFPAIVYGGSEAPVSIVLDHNDIVNQMDKPEFYEGIVLVIDGVELKVKPQDVQRHAFKPKVEHMDFIRI
ncbi:50S ribosomal protein L25 [Vibrio kasasachensis]|uniref:50S ribosomal protein L25 n=1 Tax=Vibrio kasasachensis TaxID=2910248 RepID=UPI003D0E64C0